MTRQVDTIPRRPSTAVMVVAYGVVTVVTVSALVVSAYYLWRLARQAGMPIELAWTLPVALDAGAAGATVCWVTAAAAARSWGRSIALVALLGTVGGNMLSHLIEFGLLPVTPALVIGIGAVYPAVVWAMVHLALVLRAEQRDVTEAMVNAATIRAAAARDAEQVRRAAVDDAGQVREQAKHEAGVIVAEARQDSAPVPRRALPARTTGTSRHRPTAGPPTRTGPVPVTTELLSRARAVQAERASRSQSAGHVVLRRELGVPERTAKELARRLTDERPLHVVGET